MFTKQFKRCMSGKVFYLWLTTAISSAYTSPKIVLVKCQQTGQYIHFEELTFLLTYPLIFVTCCAELTLTFSHSFLSHLVAELHTGSSQSLHLLFTLLIFEEKKIALCNFSPCLISSVMSQILVDTSSSLGWFHTWIWWRQYFFNIFNVRSQEIPHLIFQSHTYQSFSIVYWLNFFLLSWLV